MQTALIWFGFWKGRK